MFVDKVKIKCKAGNGGDGHTSFHQEKFVPNGGPDGGDGAKGGDIVFVATKSLNTLIDFYYTKHYRAENGENGGIKKCYGKMGKNLIVRVPCGTVIRDTETGNIIADLFYENEPVVLLKGGRGGLGNAHFATSRRQAPRFSQKGEKTIEREIELELKTIADVGLVGYPNVGKSTLLSVISAAKPKIANYHFTTLSPNLGVVRYHESSFLVADIPGLIDGASDGAGLGLEFLRHVERTRMLVHVVDVSGSEGRDPIEDYRKIVEELEKYSPHLAVLPHIVALNKCDLTADGEAVQLFEQAYPETTAVPISGATRQGIDELLNAIAATLRDLPDVQPIEHEIYEWEPEDSREFRVERLDEVTFEISGGLVEKLAQNVVFDNIDSMNYFHKMLKNSGIIKQLYEMGAKEGDTVVMKDMEFEFID